MAVLAQISIRRLTQNYGSELGGQGRTLMLTWRISSAGLRVILFGVFLANFLMQRLQVQMWRLLLTRSTTESRPSRPQDKFNDYVRQVTTFPGFFLEKNENTEEHRTSENYDLMIKDIVNAYKGYGSGNVDEIAKQVENSAKSILHKSSKKSERAISQDTITQINGMHYITIFYRTLRLDKTTDGKKTLVNQKYSINRSLIRINTSYLVTYAEKLEAMIGDGGLDELGRALSSPTGTRRGCRCDQVFALAKEIQVTEEDFEAAPKEA
ncbi:hypothetical protein BGW41_003471 [Actinomortierella wolfii]|nr:hypothetical protein BGW41_003471 [Actinomortierella wolfii]